MTNMQKTNMWQVLSFAAGCAAISLLSGCGKESQPSAEPERPVPEVTVVTLKSGNVALMRELPGRTHAFLVAEIRPQVSGIVKRRLFTEGQYVQAGQSLYELDDSAYRAEYESARASLLKAQATLHAAQLAAKRSSQLAKANLVSAQDNETAIASESQARADVGVAKAGVDSSRVNLAYARVVASISGRIGKSSVTEGALVTANQTNALATIQQLDPMYVEVNQPSVNWLTLKQAIDAGRIRTGDDAAGMKILLENGAAYEYDGKLQFSDVTVDTSTGNFLLRAIVPNPKSVLLPGMYVRATVNEGFLQNAILAPQRGISRDPKGNASAMVVTKESKVELRAVRVSRTIGDQWLIEDGLAAGDRVIVEGLQYIGPDMKVRAVEQAAAKTGASP
jgi:membrane fusion protein, multidrug efflux system